MKKIITYLLLLAAVGVSLVSCDQKIDATEQNHMNSDAIIRRIKEDKDYQPLTMEGLFGDKYVYARWLNHGTGKIKPIATSRVDMHYKFYIMRLNGESIADVLAQENYSSETPARFSIARGTDALIPGMRIALIHMVEGDEVEVIIPWYLGYGADPTNRVIPSYSTLKYIIRLDKIIPEDAE